MTEIFDKVYPSKKIELFSFKILKQKNVSQQPKYKTPEDPDTIVWKYLDLSKFLDLLMSQKLSCHAQINLRINTKVLLANLLLKKSENYRLTILIKILQNTP
jgi:hypothetical protein